MDFNPSLWHRLVTGEFIVSAQIDPPTGAFASLTEVQELIRKLQEAGAQTVDINSSRRLSWDSLQLAVFIEKMGLRTIPHVTARDATLDGLLKQALAAYSCGVSSFLAVSGDEYNPLTSIGSRRGVFNGDSIDLMRAFSKYLRDRKDIGAVFALGGAVNQNFLYPQDEGQRIVLKAQAGANFFMSQPVFCVEDVLRLRRFYGQYCDKPLLAGIWPLVQKKTIENIYSGKITGVIMPRHVYRLAEENWLDEFSLGQWGILNAYNLIKWVYKTKAAAGVYIIAPSRDPLRIIDLVREVIKLTRG